MNNSGLEHYAFVLVLCKNIHSEGGCAIMCPAAANTKMLFAIFNRRPRPWDVSLWNYRPFWPVSHFSAVSPYSLRNPLTVSLSASDSELTAMDEEDLELYQNETQDLTALRLSRTQNCPDPKSKRASYTTLIYYVLPALAILGLILFIIFLYDKSCFTGETH